MDQRKAFCKQRILDSSSAWKGTIDIEIFITPRNSDTQKPYILVE